MDFKARLKSAKVRHKELATYLGVSNNTVTRLVEDPEGHLSLGRARQIRDQFFPELSLDELFGYDHAATEGSYTLTLKVSEIQSMKRLADQLLEALENHRTGGNHHG